MKVWIVLLRTLGYIWLAAAGLLILAGEVGVWMKGGFTAWQELNSPFNVANWIAVMITIAPGVGALTWAGKLSARLSDRSADEGKRGEGNLP